MKTLYLFVLIICVKLVGAFLNFKDAGSITRSSMFPTANSITALSSFNLTQALVQKINSPADAMVLLSQAQKLREEASMLRTQLDMEKEAKIRKQEKKVDLLIDSLLFHGINDDTKDDEETSKVELLQTEEQVAELLISKRLDYDMVNQIFDRLVNLSNRPQSIDSCSPLLSLLLDAACKVDCLEREDNPNKRWNGRVERDLRRKLFALGYGIRIEDVENEKRAARSINGEKDLY
mmetsp:Transcript_20206/g.28420  ORF Transcript_20206/g.28420 Transcript_20206/m.28420 type:complete len:235 (-) Transcript_20206:335-1039(-)|eukprot:CAMPEP_0184857562 /NCGR_PEP_ID=MMETSP0580-20130426/2712_1 /TAXON_ID=1118495 /ORGANISM="Dactyliosolen fragilissimus" /LENGTH=234 /DNA_ID=CAMNT_0027353227 /DNA_START=85 /DNA_END=789 /DNA_ORIENTATION=+